jgi:hypothetical protein
MLRPENTDTTAIVVLTGVLVGATSQGLAYAVAWDDDIVSTISAFRLNLFCLLWSAWTFAANMLVCWNMIYRCRHAASHEHRMPHPRQQRATMRRETMFIAACMVGIFSFWIGNDAIHNQMGDVVSSLILLCMYMMGMATIVICIPEESCVSDNPLAAVDGPGSYDPPLLLVAVQTV